MLTLDGLDWQSGLSKVITILSTIYGIIMIAIPVVLLVIGTIDLVKALMAGDDREMKSATSLLLKRLIMAAAAFLVFSIVGLVTGLVNEGSWLNFWSNPSSLDNNTGNNNSGSNGSGSNSKITLENCSTGYIELTNGQSINLKANPSSVSYSSSDRAIATVDLKGNVVGKGMGVATITVKNSSRTKKCVVTVACDKDYIDIDGTCVKDPIPNMKFTNDKPYITCGQFNEQERIIIDKKLQKAVNDAGGPKTRGAAVAVARFLVSFPYRIHYKGAVKDEEIGQYHKVGLFLDPKRGWGCRTYHGTNGIDCTSFTAWTMINAGMYSTKSQAQSDSYGRRRPFKEKVNELKPGDFVFHMTKQDNGDLKQSHAGIIIGVDDKNIYVAEARGYYLQLTTVPKKTGISRLNYVSIYNKYEGEGKYENMWKE